MNKKLKVGIVGSKFAAGFHADSYSRNSKVEMVAVAALDNLEPFSKQWNIPGIYEDYSEMLKKEKLDLLSVCAPNFLHHDIVTAAARVGVNVFCEKPLATSARDAQDAMSECEKAGVKLFYGEDWCFAPALTRAISVIKEGGIGDILYVKAKECHNGTHSPFAKDKKTCGGGCLIHLAIHPIGWILHLLGEDGKNSVVEVIGKCNEGLTGNYVHKENGGEDFSLGIMKFKNGQHALVEGNYITVGGMDDKVEIYGTQGVIKVDMTMGSCVDVYSRPGYSYALEKADNTLGWTKPAVDEFYNLGYVHELAYAVDCILEDKPIMYGCSARAGTACVEIISAMYESNESGSTIRGNWG